MLPIAVSSWYITLWVAVALVFLASIAMVRSKWARQRPLARCVLLSLAAHAVLIGIAATIRFVSLPPGAGQEEPVRVTIVSMAPQPSIKAPDAQAATDEPPVDTPPDEPAPEASTVADSTIPDEPPSTEPISELLHAPDLMPDPTPTTQPVEVAAETVENQTTDTAATADTAATNSGESSNSAPSEMAVPDPEPVVPTTPPQNNTSPTPPAADSLPAKPAVPASLAERVRVDRLQSVIEQGGSRDTEQAVGQALEWLAYAQSSDGRWDASRWQGGRVFVVLGQHRRGAGTKADTAVTGLALLTFLGAGHTHLDGSYQANVANGLVFLIRSQDANGNLGSEATEYARTYSHSMATFALAEAYALTGDERLHDAVQRAVDYLLQTENKSYGGWRYNAGDRGDVSQLGWIIMALRSAEIAGIKVPDATWHRIDAFLQRVTRGRHGGLAAYQSRRGDWSRPMTAEAMYCRQVLGKPLAGSANSEAIGAIANELPGDQLTNYYYWYYATLALHHAQHDGGSAAYAWNRWNERLKRELVSGQVTDGSNAGSWSPNTVWGGCGGRVYSTAMAAMCLEVYYRYGSSAEENSPWVASRPRDEPIRR